MTWRFSQPPCHVNTENANPFFLIFHDIHPYTKCDTACVSCRYFWRERFSSGNEFAGEFEDKVRDFKKQHHSSSRGKLKWYFKSPDNKINGQLPSRGICLWMTKATVSAICLRRPPHSLIILTVRTFCPHHSVKVFLLNLNMVTTSHSPK